MLLKLIHLLTFICKKSAKVVSSWYIQQKKKNKLLTLLQSHADDEQSQDFAHEGSHHHPVCGPLMWERSSSQLTQRCRRVRLESSNRCLVFTVPPVLYIGLYSPCGRFPAGPSSLCVSVCLFRTVLLHNTHTLHLPSLHSSSDLRIQYCQRPQEAKKGRVRM